MEKATLQQEMVIMMARNDSEKAEAWITVGFTEEEAKAMVKGSTHNQAVEKFGGVWQVGNVPFCQAISKDHALKLYTWNFGYEGEEIRMINGDYVVAK